MCGSLILDYLVVLDSRQHITRSLYGYHHHRDRYSGYHQRVNANPMKYLDYLSDEIGSMNLNDTDLNDRKCYVESWTTKISLTLCVQRIYISA